MTNRQIGERLFISPKTAGLHVSNILGKLNVGNRTQAAESPTGARAGLAEPSASGSSSLGGRLASPAMSSTVSVPSSCGMTMCGPLM